MWIQQLSLSRAQDDQDVGIQWRIERAEHSYYQYSTWIILNRIYRTEANTYQNIIDFRQNRIPTLADLIYFGVPKKTQNAKMIENASNFNDMML